MLFRSAVRYSIIVTICTTALACLADEVRVKLVRRDISIPERGNVVGYVLTGGRDDLAFIPPPKWQVNLDAEKSQVRFLSPDWSTSLSCRVNWSADEKPAKLDLLATRERIQARYPEAKITTDFEWYAVSQAGRAYDLEVVSGNSKMAVREVVVPFAHGTLEITLTTLPAKFQAMHLTVGWFLNSLEIKRAGAFFPATTAAVH